MGWKTFQREEEETQEFFFYKLWFFFEKNLFINFEFSRKTYGCLVYLFNFFFHVRNKLFQIIYKFGPKFGIYLDLANSNTNFIWKLHILTQLKSKIIFLKLLRLEIIFLQYLCLCLCLQYLCHFGFEQETTCLWFYLPSLEFLVFLWHLIFWLFCWWGCWNLFYWPSCLM